MNVLRIAIVLAFGLALQIGRAVLMARLFPGGPPEWAVWTSIAVWMVLWLTLGNLLNWALERLMTRRSPRP